MVNLIYNIQDNFWQPALTHTYDLSILVGVDRLCYCIADASKKLLTLRVYNLDNQPFADSITAIIAQDAWLAMSFRNAAICCTSDFLQLIESEQFTQGVDYFTELKTIHIQEQQPLFFAQKMAIFAVNAAWSQCLNTHFKAKNIQHNAAVLLNYWNSSLINKDNNSAVFLHLQHQTLILAYFNNQNFQDFGQFKFYSTSDLLYFLLLFYQKNQLDTDIQSLHLSGELLEDSEIYKSLYKYIRHIHFLPPNERFIFTDAFANLNAYFFADLLSLEV